MSVRFIELRDRTGACIDYAVVDEDDFARLNQAKWHLNGAGYAACYDPYAGHRTMHRTLLGLTTGDGKLVDHINRDRLDNRRANLRLVTHQENAQNRRPRRPRPSSAEKFVVVTLRLTAAERDELRGIAQANRRTVPGQVKYWMARESHEERKAA